MPGHSRPKDGVLSHTYVPGIHVFICWRTASIAFLPLVPAKAGIQRRMPTARGLWIPACAGMSG
jgi:hypothetical protein